MGPSSATASSASSACSKVREERREEQHAVGAVGAVGAVCCVLCAVWYCMLIPMLLSFFLSSVRMLQVPRRNHIMAVTRGAYQNRGPSYTTKGCSIRCVRNDMSSITVTMHALDDGNASVRFSLRKSEFFIPVVMVLKCLKDCTDKEIFDKVIAGDSSNAAVAARLEYILTDFKTNSASLLRRKAALAYLGARFRVVLAATDAGCSDSLTDADVGEMLLRRYLFIHLDDDGDKFELLALMLRKLYAFVDGTVSEDNADSLMNQVRVVACSDV